MAKLYYKYGNGKSADLCETAYNYEEANAYLNDEDKRHVLVINAYDDKEIVSKYMDGDNKKPILTRKVDIRLSSITSLFDEVYLRILNGIKIAAILVDNSQYLSVQHAEDLFFIVNLLDIPVIAYGDRTLRGDVYSAGAMRLMELSNTIEEIDEEYLKKRKKAKGAKLEYYYGAMNSSKTAKLLYKADELDKAGLNVFLMKPFSDRDPSMITSRIGMQAKADLVIDNNTKLYGEGEYLLRKHINYILVDEAQFLTERQIDELKQIVRDYDIPVRCYGLKVDFLSNHFTGSGRLLETADSLVKLRTVCPCGEGAIFNARINSNGEYQKSGGQVVIDNGGNYISICPKCFIENVMDEKVPKVYRKVR